MSVIAYCDEFRRRTETLARWCPLRVAGTIGLRLDATTHEGRPASLAIRTRKPAIRVANPGTGLPNPLEQALSHKPVFDGRLSVREIQRTWDLKAELVTLSACETALGRESGGEGFVGFTQSLLMSGARSVCLSLWRVNDKATSLLMTRFYQNYVRKARGVGKAHVQGRGVPRGEEMAAKPDSGRDRQRTGRPGAWRGAAAGEGHRRQRKEASPSKSSALRPYDHPYYWAAFVLVGDPD